MKQKIISIALALILIIGISAIPAYASFNAAPWAIPELEKALDFGLIPDVLNGADLTRPITRAEFAAVAVKAYENFTGTTVTPVSPNPFTDTSNADVLKAYSINLVNGRTATTYDPNGQLTRQDAATMMMRVEKRAYIPGWTLANDNTFTLNFTQPARFSDDSGIADYARTAVYFMVAKEVINGTGNNMFSPAVVASRQEALIIAVRMVEKLKGRTLDYTQGGTTPTSGSIDARLVGLWGSGFTIANWQNAINGIYGYSYGSMFGIEFKADGTFFSMYTNSSRQANDDVFTVRTHYGNYEIENNQILLTNRMSMLVTYKAPVGSTDRQIVTAQTDTDYRPYANQVLNYQLDDDRLDLSHPTGVTVSTDMVKIGTLWRVVN